MNHGTAESRRLQQTSILSHMHSRCRAHIFSRALALCSRYDVARTDAASQLRLRSRIRARARKMPGRRDYTRVFATLCAGNHGDAARAYAHIHASSKCTSLSSSRIRTDMHPTCTRPGRRAMQVGVEWNAGRNARLSSLQGAL